MTGNEWTDQVCVTDSACINDFEFFLVQQQTGLRDPIDGVLGLARNLPYYLAPQNGVTRGPSYMMAMQNAGLIDENTFSTYMVKGGEQSFMDFGKPREDRMRDRSEMAYINLNEDFFWSAFCQGFAIGNTNNGWSWGSVKDQSTLVDDGNVYSIFDTGASAIVFPKTYFSQLLTQLYATMVGDEYELAQGYVVTKCYSDFPTLYFLFDGKWLSVDPSEYVVDISEGQDRSICVLLLSQGEEPFIVMGLPIYMDYYTVHDELRTTIGFTPNSASSKSAVSRGTKPTRILESANPPDPPVNAWSWVISIALCVIFCSFLVLLVTENNDDDERGGRRGGFNETSLIFVAAAMGIIFCLVVFYYLQPIINQWIVGAVHVAATKQVVGGNNYIYYFLGAILCLLVAKKTF